MKGIKKAANVKLLSFKMWLGVKLSAQVSICPILSKGNEVSSTSQMFSVSDGNPHNISVQDTSLQDCFLIAKVQSNSNFNSSQILLTETWNSKQNKLFHQFAFVTIATQMILGQGLRCTDLLLVFFLISYFLHLHFKC